MSPFRCHIPTRLYFGGGAFEEVGSVAAELGRRALLVTARQSVHRFGYFDQLTSQLNQQGIAWTCFRAVSSGATTDNVDRGAETAQEVRADLIIALGGGSALDCGKAIAGVAASQQAAVDFLYGKAVVTRDALPVLAIPTTAGTGSEMNRSAIVTDPHRPFRDGIRSSHLIPRAAIVDPQLTHSVPADVTAQTGFDVLAHAVESFVSPRSQPITDALALNAATIVSHWLPRVLEDPHDPVGREQLAYASTSMGINLGRVGTCLPHRIDKAICALFPEIPHGRCIATLYPAWAELSWRGQCDRFARLVDILDPSCEGSQEERAAMFPQCVRRFLETLGMPESLASFGVSEADIPRLQNRIAGNISINPVPIDEQDLSGFLRSVLRS